MPEAAATREGSPTAHGIAAAAESAAASARPDEGGTLLAVCGLCGGAGASTLAYLIGRHACVDGGPVLVSDTGGPTGGLATYARVESPRSLPRTANAVAAHEPLAEGLFANDGDGLRVIATAPHRDVAADPRGIARVLDDARQAHALTVVDCGTPRGAIEAQILETATHVVWVVPATAGGIARGRQVLDLFGSGSWRAEAVVARRDSTEGRAGLDLLSELAASRSAPLVLMPHVPDLASRGPDTALELAGVTLEAIRTVLRR
jgi:Flp pilus assembly CpaE family ATPase